MEGKMAAGAFGRARNYGWDVPFDWKLETEIETEMKISYSVNTLIESDTINPAAMFL